MRPSRAVPALLAWLVLAASPRARAADAGAPAQPAPTAAPAPAAGTQAAPVAPVRPPAAAPAGPAHPDLPDALKAVVKTKKARFAGAWGGYDLRARGSVLALSPDGRRAACAGPGSPLRVWDLETGRQTRLLAPLDGVTATAFAPDGKHVASGAHDGAITVWDVETGKAERVLKRHQGEVSALAYSPDGKRVASGGEDMTVRVWDLGKGRGLVLHGHTEMVRALAWFHDGKQLASTGDDGTVRIWDLTKGRAVKVFGAGEGPECSALAVSPDGARLLVGREGVGVVRAEVETGEEQVLGAAARVLALGFSADGARELAVVSSQREVRLASTRDAAQAKLEIWGWEAEASEALSPISEADTGSLAAAFSKDGTRALTSASGLTVWDLVGAAATRRTLGHTARIEALAVSRDGAYVLSAAEDTTARLWDVFSGKERFTFGGHSKAVRAVAFSKDGTKALVADAMGLMRLFDVAKGTAEGYVGPQRGIVTATFAEDDKVVATASLERTATWDAATGKEIFSNWFPRIVTAVAVSADGKLAVATDLVDGTMMREVATGKVLRPLNRPDRIGRGVTLNRDGSLAAVVTSASDGAGPDALELWDTVQGKLLRAGRVTPGFKVLCFSDDAKLLLASAGDATVRMLATRTLKETDKVDLSANGEQPISAAFLPDGLSFLLGTSSGALQHYLIVADPAK
ncbi:MAG TPA: WD40 repeat domain-containing protein [Myxococcales bacterium]|jgi:WD40 repeat protein